jgi:hypothetical protein
MRQQSVFMFGLPAGFSGLEPTVRMQNLWGSKGGVALAIIVMALMFVIGILIFSVLPAPPLHTGA